VSGHRVLIVDDESIVRDVLGRYLEKEGFRVDSAADGETAIELAARSRPDIVLLDLMLPKVDGLEVFRRIREVADIPVVMITAKGEEVDRVVGLELGADDYVAKPFSPREVVARIRAVLPTVTADWRYIRQARRCAGTRRRSTSRGRSSTSSSCSPRTPAAPSLDRSCSRACGTSLGTATPRP